MLVSSITKSLSWIREESVAQVLLCMLVFHSNMSFAAEYIVGDGKGWSFGVQNWPAGKTFKAGDTLGKDHTIIICLSHLFNFLGKKIF